MKPMHHKQHGVTLVVALVMLVLLTLLVLTSANLGNGSLQTVGNMQYRNEAAAAAQEAIEQVISKEFYQNPDVLIPSDDSALVNTMSVDTKGDGNKNVTVTLDKAQCKTAQPYVPPEVKLSDPQEVTCVQEQDSTTPSLEMPGVNTACWNAVWELQAHATDKSTGASVDVVQGVEMPVQQGYVPNTCMPPSS